MKVIDSVNRGWIIIAVSVVIGVYTYVHFIHFLNTQTKEVNAKPTSVLSTQMMFRVEPGLTEDTSGKILTLLTVEKIEHVAGFRRVLARNDNNSVLYSAISSEDLKPGDKVFIWRLWNQIHPFNGHFQEMFIATAATNWAQ